MPRPIIVVGPTPPPTHGVSVMVVELLGALRAAGLLAAHLDTRDDRGLRNIGRIDPRNVWLALRHGCQFARLLRRHRDAAVYVPISQNRLGFLRDAIFLVLARLAGRKRYVHLHGGYFREFRDNADPWTRLVIRVALAGVEQAWVLTPGLRRAFDGLVPPERVRVLQNTARTTEPVAAARGNDDRLRVLFLSNLMPEKGCFELTAALVQLGDAAAGLHVRVGGDGTDEVRRRVEGEARYLRRHGVELELLGHLSGAEKDAAFAWADVFAFPTRYPYEGQPVVLIEAMAAGLAIVTANLGGIAETVRPGREALVIEPGDTAALAATLRQFEADPELRERLGRAAHARYELLYRPERHAADVLALIGAEAADDLSVVPARVAAPGDDAGDHAGHPQRVRMH